MWILKLGFYRMNVELSNFHLSYLSSSLVVPWTDDRGTTLQGNIHKHKCESDSNPQPEELRPPYIDWM